MRTYLLQEPVLLSCIKPTVVQILCLGDAQFKKHTTSFQNDLLFRINLEREKRRAPKPKKKHKNLRGSENILVKNKGNVMYDCNVM